MARAYGIDLEAPAATMRAHVEALAALLPRAAIAFDAAFSPRLDYYTGIVFETTVDGWERFGSIASGGRYDDLASLFIKRRLPGVGDSIGLDRLVALMDEAGWLPGAATTAPVLVANFPGVGSTMTPEGERIELFERWERFWALATLE